LISETIRARKPGATKGITEGEVVGACADADTVSFEECSGKKPSPGAERFGAGSGLVWYGQRRGENQGRVPAYASRVIEYPSAVANSERWETP
jgi:hypothetical protein